MTKAQFIAMFQAMYRIANLADSDNEDRADWTDPDMAGYACCRHLDAMSNDMIKCGVFTEEERQAIYDTL